MTMSDERPDSTDVGNQIGTGLRLVAAVAILIGGLVHLQLYLDGYRDFPDANLGRSFLLNVVASVIVVPLTVKLSPPGCVAKVIFTFRGWKFWVIVWLKPLKSVAVKRISRKLPVAACKSSGAGAVKVMLLPVVGDKYGCV